MAISLGIYRIFRQTHVLLFLKVTVVSACRNIEHEDYSLLFSLIDRDQNGRRSVFALRSRAAESCFWYFLGTDWFTGDYDHTESYEMGTLINCPQ